MSTGAQLTAAPGNASDCADNVVGASTVPEGVQPGPDATRMTVDAVAEGSLGPAVFGAENVSVTEQVITWAATPPGLLNPPTVMGLVVPVAEWVSPEVEVHVAV